MEKQIIAVAVGCIIALALWKGTNQNWFLSLLSVFVIALTFKFADDVGFPLDILVFAAGFLGLGIGKFLFVDLRKPELGRPAYLNWLRDKLSNSQKSGDTKEADKIERVIEKLEH